MSADRMSPTSKVEVTKIEHFPQSEYQGQYQQVILPISNHDYHYHQSQPLVTAGQQYYESSRQTDSAPAYHYENGAYYHLPTNKVPQETLSSNNKLASNKLLTMKSIDQPTRTNQMYNENQNGIKDRANPQVFIPQASVPQSTEGSCCI